MEGTNQNKANFTNLAETYMYDRKEDDRLNRNFYKYYKNNANDIEDPIFTGFTFSIDTLHSPLFFTGGGYETTDILRSIDGGRDSLAKTIENRLGEIYRIAISGSPDSYEINAISAKDNIGDSHLAGFGLQDIYYLDNVQYGATDYIYMVDRVPSNSYSDEIGTYDIGNGTPNVSEFTEQANTISMLQTSLATENAGLDGVDLSNMSKEEFNKYANEALNSRRAELGGDDSDDSDLERQHIANENSYNEHKQKYESKTITIDNDTYSYDAAIEKLQELKDKVEKQKTDVSSKLSTFQTNADRLLKRLEGNVSDTTLHAEIKTNNDKFKEFYGNISKDFPDIDVTTSTLLENNYEKYEKKVSQDLYKDPYKIQFQRCWQVLDFKIIGRSIKNGTQEKINNITAAINKLEGELFGVVDGVPCSKENPAQNSLAWNMNEAKRVMDNDEYSRLKNEIRAIEDIQTNYDDFKTYGELNSKKKTTPQLSYPDGIVETEGNRQTTEVPQTVYDMLGFISGMKKLTEKYPYILQTVSGLDEAYRKYFLMTEPYQGSAKDKISISCYESLDLRITSMFNKYFNAVYDRQYKRERVPVNLRRFQCSIFVHDIRNFRNTLGRGIFSNNFPEMETGDGVEKIIELALNYMSVIEFKFFDCEIVPEETGNIFDSVSNADVGDMKQTTFAFTYGNCVINFLPFEVLNKYHKSSGTRATDNNKQYSKDTISAPTMSAKEEEHMRKTLKEQRELYNDVDNIGNGDFRMWFDKSPIGNVNNNDYREYYKSTASVYVDDYFRTTIANDFALGSLSQQNKDLTERENAIIKYILGVSASTGLPVERVTDALNIKYIDKLFTEDDLATPVIKEIGNVTNIEEQGVDSTTYTAKNLYEEDWIPPTITDLGNAFKN